MYLTLAILIMVFYFIAAAMQGFRLLGNEKFYKWIALLLGLIAASMHTVLLYHWIDTQSGQNLSPMNLFSLVSWLVAILVLLAALTRPVENLGVFIFPLAALSVLLAIIFPIQNVVNTKENIGQLIHIVLSTLTLSVLCAAGLQALLLAIQERQLHHKRLKGVVQALPPLETMENLLFQMIGLGFILLTILLLTSILFFHDILEVHRLQKTLTTILAWGIFATLLIGRSIFGWRGRIAIQWTIGGVSLLLIIYFGSRLLLSFIS